ncbi:MAG: LPP20 family lipoprotein [Sulfurimonas sp.]|nr:LPP20 family lipoprotein [Sulfurimonas sp.]
MTQKTPVPKWVYSILPDNDKKIFGLAVGKDREAAIQAALNNMVSKLGITIESSFERSEKFSHSYLKVSDKSVIKANISKIKINNYKVIKSHRLNYKEFAVLLETDKQILAKGLRDDLEIRKSAIVQKKNSLANSDMLTKYNGIKSLQKEAEALMPTILILSELDKQFDKKSNLSFISEIQNEFLLLNKNLKFYIFGDKKSMKFVDGIKNYLAKNSFNIAQSKKSAILVKLSTTDNLNKSHSSIVRITIKISVYDSGKYIGGKSIIIKERYSSSESNVYKNASIHFMQEIDSMGINKAIGINLNLDKS